MPLTSVGRPLAVDAGVAGAAADAALVPPHDDGGVGDDGPARAVLLRHVEEHGVATQAARGTTRLKKRKMN